MTITKTKYRLRSRKGEAAHQVTAYYPFDIETYAEVEKQLTDIAKGFGGSTNGAGTDLVTQTRDVDWDFPTKQAADDFMDALKGFAFIEV